MRRSVLASTFLASPNIEPRRDGNTPDMLVLHYTGMPDAKKACRGCAIRLDKSHAIIGRRKTGRSSDGGRRHAGLACGVSSWKGQQDLNSCSIGIEIQNPAMRRVTRIFRKPDAGCHCAVQGYRGRDMHSPTRVLAHSDIAPERKIDPGEKFDWARLQRKAWSLGEARTQSRVERSCNWVTRASRLKHCKACCNSSGYGAEGQRTLRRPHACRGAGLPAPLPAFKGGRDCGFLHGHHACTGCCTAGTGLGFPQTSRKVGKSASPKGKHVAG